MGDGCFEHSPRKATAEDFSDPVLFDLVVGQYVLPLQPDSAAFIRLEARRIDFGQLRSHGLIAFREIDMRKAFETLPPVSRLDDEQSRKRD